MSEVVFAFPLSFGQQRLWFLDQLTPGNSFYNIPAAIRLFFPVNVAVLDKSLNEIVRRHESLRTTFRNHEGAPRQIISPFLEAHLRVTDLRKLPESQRNLEAERLAREEASLPFDLANGPLVRTTLLRLNEAESVFLLTLHHIIADGWSLQIFWKELNTLYAAFSAERPSPLPELDYQYPDFAVWQREWVQGKNLSSQLKYWKNQLQDLALLQLPTDRPRPSVQSFRGSTHFFRIPNAALADVGLLSRRHGVTLFMTLLAAFKALLSRYSSQTDIIVGTPTAGRIRSELEPLIGFFVSTLVMRTDLSGDPTFGELLERVKRTALDAFAHQEIPFEKLVEELRPERNLSRNPLFQITFQLLTASGKTQPQSTGPATSPLLVQRGTAIFDLAFNLWEDGDQVHGQIEYSTDLFDAETIHRMASHYVTLLEAAVRNPTLRLSTLPLLSQAERKQLLVVWNSTQQAYPRDRCAHELFEEQVSRSPEATAVVFDGREITFRDLNEQADRLASILKNFGVGPDILVAIFLERSVEMMVALLATLKAGGAYVPLDAQYPSERLNFMIEDAKPAILLTEETLLQRLRPTGMPWLLVKDGSSAKVQNELAPKPGRQVRPEDLAYVIYTSGSTGRPKGIMVPHRGLVNYLHWCATTYPVFAGIGAPLHSSISFDLSITSLFVPLLSGRAVHLVPEAVSPATLAGFLKSHHDFSLIKITPSHLRLLRQDLPGSTVKGLAHAFVVGGENLLAEDIQFWQEAAPEIRIFNEYGPSETVVGCCVYESSVGRHHTGSIPIGRPIANTQLYILDAALQPVPVGIPGELYIGGDGLARGYLNRPELTAEKFLPDPFNPAPGRRLYKSGDRARYLADGTIEFLGRIDDQVKLRGFRIELGEIEAVLREHPRIREAVVEFRNDLGMDPYLVAYLAARDNPAPDSAELRHFLERKFPNYMVPSSFVWVEAFRLTRNGKIDRAALPRPNDRRLRAGDAYVPPRNALERFLAGLWSRVTGGGPVGMDDNFFRELGGHSLSATQLCALIKESFQLEFPLRLIFESASVGQFADALRREYATPERLEKTAELLLAVEQMSEDEVEAMLVEHSQPAS
jgi:amino acid adenylation domain-containing protein